MLGNKEKDKIVKRYGDYYWEQIKKLSKSYYKDIEERAREIEQKDQRIAELEQELAELKEKAIVPKFKIGQEIYYYHIARNKIYLGCVEDIQYFATRSGIFYVIPNLQRDYFWIREDELFATEQEAQAKLKEMNGNV